MNLYRISQTENDGCDTYDSAIVAAESEDEARHIHPSHPYGKQYEWNDCALHVWASTPDKVEVEHIGQAKDGTPAGIILASFNAG